MKHYFIMNPAAGKGGEKEKLRDSILAAGEEASVSFEIYKTKCQGDATDFVSRTCLENPHEELRFYACGGDGTFGEVVRGAMGFAHAAVGVLPAGTGNDFVRNFENHVEFSNPLSQLGGSVISLDVLKYNDSYSPNMINIGFDCESVKKTTVYKTYAWMPRKLAYLAGVFVTLVKKPGVKMTVSIDGEEPVEKQLLLSTFANGSFCGGGFHSNPLATLCDGMVDGLFIKNVTRRRFVTLVSSYKKGTHICEKNANILVHKKFKSVQMTFSSPQSISVDGEITDVTSLCIECVPSAMRFILPAGVTLLAMAEEPIPEMASV